MNSKKTTFLAGFIFSILSLILLAGVGLPAPAVRADLPDRNTPTPAPAPDSGGDEKDSATVGAWIQLRLSGAPAGGWSGKQRRRLGRCSGLARAAAAEYALAGSVPTTPAVAYPLPFFVLKLS